MNDRFENPFEDSLDQQIDERNENADERGGLDDSFVDRALDNLNKMFAAQSETENKLYGDKENNIAERARKAEEVAREKASYTDYDRDLSREYDRFQDPEAKDFDDLSSAERSMFNETTFDEIAKNLSQLGIKPIEPEGPSIPDNI